MNPLPMPSGGYLSDLALGATEEPGRIIAAIVSEGSDFRKVLTDTRTRLNGAMESFYLSRTGQALLKQLPPGTFRDGPNGPFRLDSGAGMRKDFRWVDRGTGHAGIMTTWAFQQFTNGYRAKANRVYEAFLCRRFVIPPGTIDANTDSDDLLVRQPCANCHQLLEPMGAFFNNWALEGTNYLYRGDYQPYGKFMVGDTWQSGTDTQGLGKIIGDDPRFAECASARAFEFVMGRSPNPFERSQVVSQTVAKFSERFDFMAALITVLNSDSFRGPQQ
jgi:hypothetical protein